MDDRKLTTLLAAVEHGSLSKAAASLGLTQAGVTQMMNSLEEELGCTLLVRTYNGIKLTPAGEELLPFIRDAAASLNHLREEANNYVMGQLKTIRIGIYPSITKSWLPQVLKDYKKEYPSTSIDITVGGEEIPRYLDENIIDIAIAEENQKGNYCWNTICEDKYYAIVPQNHELSGKDIVEIDELLKYPFIMSQINELKEKLKPYTSAKIVETIQIHSIDDDALISLVEQGLGVSILPGLSLKDISENVCVLPLKPELKRKLGIMMPRSVREQVQTFVDFVHHLDISKY